MINDKGKKYPKCIFITGFARSGKDTMGDVLHKYLSLNSLHPKKYSFAAPLKKMCEKQVKDNYGLSVYSENTEDKSKFRQLLVDTAKMYRDNTKGEYFHKIIQTDILFDWNEEHNFSKSFIPIITDLRFAEFHQHGTEEINFAVKAGIIIDVIQNGINAPNDTEKFNMDLIRKIAPLYLDTYYSLYINNYKTLNEVRAKMSEFIKTTKIEQLCSI